MNNIKSIEDYMYNRLHPTSFHRKIRKNFSTDPYHIINTGIYNNLSILFDEIGIKIEEELEE